MKKHKDNIFNTTKKVSDFKFNKKVADVFDEMILRSVPFYDEIQRMVCEQVQKFAQKDTNIYDLGCSTGNTIYHLSSQIRSQNIKFIGMDNSSSMLKHAETRLKESAMKHPYRLVQSDLGDKFKIQNASAVTLILTMQFIRPIQREQLIKRIFEGLNKGGALIVVEKIIASDSLTNRMFLDNYFAFKKRNGYSDLEIAKKREALENVLIPYTVDENKLLLRQCGFEVVDSFFQWYNFAGFIAVKSSTVL